jgi:hypothetical protein
MSCRTSGLVDLSLLGFEYVADHLKKRDRRKAEAALHDPKFNHFNNTDAACMNCKILSISKTKYISILRPICRLLFSSCLFVLYSNLEYTCFSFSHHQ